MNTTLLDTFFSEDGDAYVCHMLLDAIHKQKETGLPLVSEFNFNHFNVILDFEKQQVALQDDWTIDQEGEINLGLDEFEKLLQESRLW